MPRTVVRKPGQTFTLHGSGFYIEVSQPGYYVAIEPRAPLTDEERDVFAATGGERALYSGAAGLFEATNIIYPEA